MAASSVRDPGVTPGARGLPIIPAMESRRPLVLAGLLLACALSAPARAESAFLREAMAVADRVMVALDLLGTPYRARGTSPDTGFDCSGFIGHVFRAANGIVLPRSSDEMFRMGVAGAQDVAREGLAAGDLLFFRIGRRGERIDHVGMYVGEGRFVHAPASGGEVRLESLDMPYWQRHFAGARRLPAAPGQADDGIGLD